MIDRLRSLLSALFRRDRFEDGMADELRFHVDAYAEDLVRAGVPRAEAARRARLEFGGVEGIKEDCRQARGLRLFDELRQDVRYAVRLMAKTPGFTAAAILSLALGIGANAAIFSLMDALLLQTLPVASPNELYFFAHGTGDRVTTSSNYPLFERYRSLTDVFSGVAASDGRTLRVSTPAGVEPMSGQFVSGNYHAVLGVPVVLGRGFTSEPDRTTDSSLIAVISHDYWTRRFRRDPEILGKTIVVQGKVVSIVGVTGRGVHGLAPGTRVDITLPLAVKALDEPGFLNMRDGWISLRIVGRLKPDVSEARARAAVDAVFQQFWAEPENQWARDSSPNTYRSAVLSPAGKGSSGLRQRYARPLGVLMAMVGVVLLIACANVANLVLARAVAREKEVAIRLGIGATRGRLVRQFLTESTILALCGGGIGLLVAAWGADWILALLNVGPSPVFLETSPNARVLGFTTAIAMVTGIGFGLAPALRGTDVEVPCALKKNVGQQSRSPGRWATGKVLVAGQIALSVLLLSAAGLLVRSVHHLKTVNAGFQRANVLLFSLDASGAAVPESRRASWFGELLDRLRAMPAVLSASASIMSPIGTSVSVRRIQMPDLPASKVRDVWANEVTPDYFETLGIVLIRGRTFTWHDAAASEKVGVVNETMARFYFGSADPLGRRFAFGSELREPRDMIRIVGLVRDARDESLREAPPRMVYTPLAQAQEPPDRVTVAIRRAQAPSALTGTLRETVRAFHKELVVGYVRTMEQQVDASLLRERVLANLGTCFGLLALLLAAIGLFGVMSYEVVRRTREIGIRIALGAARATVLWQVLREIVLMAAAGIVLGLGMAIATMHLISAFLFGLSAHDPVTLGAATGVLLATALVAGYLPARRAASVDPIRALRAE